MNIIISGMTCSGKTTLSNEIQSIIPDICIFREDDYMNDLRDIPHTRGYYLMDLPSSYKLDEFVSDAGDLIRYGCSYYPKYDTPNNRRINKDEIVYKKKLNVFEGLHTIDALKDLRDSIKIFVDTPPSLCLQRRILRDKENYNALEREVEKYFNEVIMSIYKTHIVNQKELADVIIRGEEDKKCILKKLQTYY